METYCACASRQKKVARRYSFKQLIAGVAKKNTHAEFKTGFAVGREAL
jgi:hypothetical protein